MKRNDIDLKDIKPKNVDDIIKGVSGAAYKSFDENIFKEYIDEIENIRNKKTSKTQLDELADALKKNEYIKLNAQE